MVFAIWLPLLVGFYSVNQALGENFHTDFSAWEYERGHESDPWKTRPDPSWIGAPLMGRRFMHYDNSRANRFNPDPSAEVRWGEQTWEEMMLGYYGTIEMPGSTVTRSRRR